MTDHPARSRPPAESIEVCPNCRQGVVFYRGRTEANPTGGLPYSPCCGVEEPGIRYLLDTTPPPLPAAPASIRGLDPDFSTDDIPF